MKSLTFIEVQDFNTYVLEDDSKQKITLVIELYNISKPKAGDKLLISEKLLDKKSEQFCIPYAFELTDELDPRQINKLNDCEFAVLRLNDKNFSIKRIYG